MQRPMFGILQAGMPHLATAVSPNSAEGRRNACRHCSDAPGERVSHGELEFERGPPASAASSQPTAAPNSGQPSTSLQSSVHACLRSLPMSAAVECDAPEPYGVAGQPEPAAAAADALADEAERCLLLSEFEESLEHARACLAAKPGPAAQERALVVSIQALYETRRSVTHRLPAHKPPATPLPHLPLPPPPVLAGWARRAAYWASTSLGWRTRRRTSPLSSSRWLWTASTRARRGARFRHC